MIMLSLSIKITFSLDLNVLVSQIFMLYWFNLQKTLASRQLGLGSPDFYQPYNFW